MKLKTLIAFLLVCVLAGTVFAASQKHAAVSDDAIYDLVRRKLASDPVVKGGAFQVDVKAGAVTLRGKVETGKQKERASKLTRKVKGVQSVDNQLTVTGKEAR